METKTICNEIRSRTGLKITEYAKKEKVSTKIIYKSCKGEGSRYIRIKIAKILGTLPSQIWREAPEEQRIIDDMKYNRSMSHG